MENTKSYPTGSERIELLNRKSTLMASLELKIQDLLDRTMGLHPLARLVIAESQQQGLMPTSEIEYAVKILSLYNTRRDLRSPISNDDITEMYNYTIKGFQHELDFKFMIMDWCLENFPDNPLILHQPSQLPINNPRVAFIYVRDVLAKGGHVAKELYKSQVRVETLAQYLKTVFSNSKEYWLNNIRECPVETYPPIGQVQTNLNDNILDLINKIKSAIRM